MLVSSVVSRLTPAPHHERIRTPLLSSRCRQQSASSTRALASRDNQSALHLPYEGRQAVLKAMEELEHSATAAEVAGQSGLSISEAERLLQWLVLSTRGSMKVTESGDLIYTIPSSSRQALLLHNAELRAEAALQKAGEVGTKVAKTTFAATLYASIAFCFLLLVFLAIASSNSDNRDSRRGPSFSFTYLPDFWLFTSNDRRRGRSSGRTRSKESEATKSFLEAVTSWVFGDGDPNRGFDEARWAAAAQYIQAHGGVVAAEEMRPFLDHTDGEEEEYMIPLLLRLGGEVIIDGGVLLYRFPELQKRARAVNTSLPKGAANSFAKVGALMSSLVGLKHAAAEGNEFAPAFITPAVAGAPPVAQKQPLVMSTASRSQLLGVQLLALVNAVLVVSAWSAVLAPGGAALVLLGPTAATLILKFVLPFLSFYSWLYVAGPLARAVGNAIRNKSIAKENQERVEAAMAVANAPAELRAKIDRARLLAESRDISREAVAFDSSRTDADAAQRDDWDTRFQNAR